MELHAAIAEWNGDRLTIDDSTQNISGQKGKLAKIFGIPDANVTREGRLTTIRHEVCTNTSFLEDYLESSAVSTRRIYACLNVSTTHRLVQLNLGTPTYMHGMVRVPRVVAVYDVGTLINEKTAKSQFIGGIVWALA